MQLIQIIQITQIIQIIQIRDLLALPGRSRSWTVLGIDHTDHLSEACMIVRSRPGTLVTLLNDDKDEIEKDPYQTFHSSVAYLVSAPQKASKSPSNSSATASAMRAPTSCTPRENMNLFSIQTSKKKATAAGERLDT